MKITKTYCDRCGKESLPSETHWEYVFRPVYVGGTTYASQEAKPDGKEYCYHCRNHILDAFYTAAKPIWTPPK